MKEKQLLDFYKAIEGQSAAMLAAAQQNDWQTVADCEKSCTVLIGELRIQGEKTPLSPELRREKTRIMQRILRNDAQIRILAEPWLATLENMGRMPAAQKALH